MTSKNLLVRASAPSALCAWVASRPQTASHPNSEVKLGRVQVVLRRGTTREGWMLQVFLFLLCLFVFCCLFPFSLSCFLPVDLHLFLDLCCSFCWWFFDLFVALFRCVSFICSVALNCLYYMICIIVVLYRQTGRGTSIRQALKVP